MRIWPGMSLEDFVRKHHVQLIRKDESRAMRWLDRLMRLWGYRGFLDRAWTTIGHRIYYPAHISSREGVQLEAWLGMHRSPIEHEFHHIVQFERLGVVLMALLYLFLPVPVFFAWGRWVLEREPYLYQIRNHDRSIDEVVETLWKVYLFPWPRTWMRRWFERHA